MTVVELGNVTRAAKALNMTQPALSLRLKQLAEQTGLELFRRSARGLAPTVDGSAFARKAAGVLAAEDELERSVRHLQGHIRGTLRIGTVIDPAFIRLGAFLRDLVAAAPLLEKELRHGMSGDVRDWVLHGEVDAGFYLGEVAQGVDESSAQRIELRPLTDFAYWVVAPRGWEERVEGKDWSAVALLPWIGTVAGSVHARLLQQVFAGREESPRFVAWVDQESSMLAMVRSGVGLSLCRDSVALQEKRSNGLVVNDRLRIDCSLSFICLKARRQEPAIACALDVLAGLWASSQAPEQR